jgi:tetratricopeptide (TPR) repeat protein
VWGLTVNIEFLLKSMGIWTLHVGRTALWVLLGISCLLLFLRCLLLRLFPERFGLPAPAYPSIRKLNLLLITLLCGISVSIYLILKPDSQFLTYIAEKAISEKNYEEAVYAYESLADWGTDRVDIYSNLAISYINLGRYKEAIMAFHQAQALSSDILVDNYYFCARAHEQIGEYGAAVSHLKEALAVTQSPEQQIQIRIELKRLQQSHPELAQ